MAFDPQERVSWTTKGLQIIMITQEEAEAAIERVSEEFKHLSYEELERRAILQESGQEEPTRQLRIAGETAYVGIVFAKLGRFRKRVSVEVSLSGEGDSSVCRFSYFERFESGHFYPSPRATQREAALGKVFPYASILVMIVLATYFLLKLLNAE